MDTKNEMAIKIADLLLTISDQSISIMMGTIEMKDTKAMLEVFKLTDKYGVLKNE